MFSLPESFNADFWEIFSLPILFNCSSRAADQVDPIPTPREGDMAMVAVGIEDVASGEVTRSDSFGEGVEIFKGL